MPTSHHRHRRSPFKRTSFQRTSSISSSTTSIFPSSDITPTPPPTHKPTIQHSPSATPSHMHMHIHHPPINALAIQRKRDTKIQEHDQRTEHEISGHQSLNPRLEYSSSRSYSSPFRDLSIPISCLSSSVHLSATPGRLSLKSKSRSESEPNINPKSCSRYSEISGNITPEEEEEEEEEPEHQNCPPKKKSLRPFLRKCVHSFSFRSSFRLIGWIEDPVVLGDCRGSYRSGTRYAYGGRMGDARLWDEARRGVEG